MSSSKWTIWPFPQSDVITSGKFWMTKISLLLPSKPSFFSHGDSTYLSEIGGTLIILEANTSWQIIPGLLLRSLYNGCYPVYIFPDPGVTDKISLTPLLFAIISWAHWLLINHFLYSLCLRLAIKRKLVVDMPSTSSSASDWLHRRSLSHHVEQWVIAPAAKSITCLKIDG